MGKRGQPKKLYPPEREREIVDAIVRGVKPAKLAPLFGVSATVMARWMGELAEQAKAARKEAVEKAAAARPAPKPAPVVDDADDDDEDDVDFTDATLKEIDEMLIVAKEKAEAAASIDNADEHATYMRMIIALLDARRKMSPPPKIDPNENPDMQALAQQAREKLHKLADTLVRVSKSPLAESIAAILRPASEENEQAD